ncbi:MAG: YraN family protein [Thiohalospira sp.]|uniref:YraN family protein n=1 Tax=Thiohalospira sp. TaxID=3080549 RepID=UPI003980F269
MARAKGDAAEERALNYLRGQGLTLITRNWHCRMGELDLVMRDGEELVIVEVRQRSRSGYGTAAESITATKRQRLTRATRHYLQRHPPEAQRPVRFDVVALDGNGDPEWIRHAFLPEAP